MKAEKLKAKSNSQQDTMRLHRLSTATWFSCIPSEPQPPVSLADNDEVEFSAVKGCCLLELAFLAFPCRGSKSYLKLVETKYQRIILSLIRKFHLTSLEQLPAWRERG